MQNSGNVIFKCGFAVSMRFENRFKRFYTNLIVLFMQLWGKYLFREINNENQKENPRPRKRSQKILKREKNNLILFIFPRIPTVLFGSAGNDDLYFAWKFFLLNTPTWLFSSWNPFPSPYNNQKGLQVIKNACKPFLFVTLSCGI